MRAPRLPAVLPLALALALAARARAEPRVDVAFGFDGAVRSDGFAPLRVDVENDGPAWSGTLSVRQQLMAVGFVTWEFPLEVPAGGRRREHHVLALAPGSALPLPSALQWSLDGRSWKDLPFHAADSRPDSVVVVVVSERGVAQPALRQALDPDARGGAQVPVVAPADLPVDAVAWESVDVVVVEAATCDRIEPAAWRALADRFRLGGTFVLHGSEPPPCDVPPELLAATPAGPAVALALPFLAEGAKATAAPLAAAPGALKFEADGVTWAARLSRGATRLVTVGIDLAAASREDAASAAPWDALLDVPNAAAIPWLRTRLASPFLELSRLSESRRRLDSRRVAAACAAAALVLALAALAAHLRRRGGRDGDRAWRVAPFFGAVAAGPFLVGGALLRLQALSPEPLVVVETFAGAASARTRTRLEVSGQGGSQSVELPGTAVQLPGDPSMPWTSLALRGARFDLGTPASADGLRPSAFRAQHVEVVEWAPGGGLEVLPDGRVRNGTGFQLDSVRVTSGGATRVSVSPLAPGATAELRDETLAPSTPHATLHAACAAASPVATGLASARSSWLEAPRPRRLVASWLEEAP